MTPLALNRVQLALFEAISTMVSPTTVAWAYGEQPFDQLPSTLVNLTLAGFDAGIRRIARGRVVLPLTSATLDLPSVAAGDLLSIRLNGRVFRFEATGTGPTAARDGMLAELTGPLEVEGVVCAASGASALAFAPDTSPIWDLVPSSEFTVAAFSTSDDAVEVVERTHTLSVQVDCYSKGREPRNGAWVLASQARATFEAQDLVDEMSDRGLGVLSLGPVIDTSAVAGGFWESRCSFDVELSTPANFTRPVDVVETVTGALELATPSGSLITQNITVNSP